MRIFLLILLLLAMGATAYVLVRGVMLMASGKDVTGEQSQQWMRRRGLFQAVAIVLVVLILVGPGAANKKSGCAGSSSTRSTRGRAAAAAPVSSTAAG